MKQSGNPHLAKQFAALNDAALLDALARRSEYTEAAIDVACEEASRRGLHLPESKRPWVATPAPPTPRSPVITGWSIAIALTYFLVFFELGRLVERPRLWGWLGWVMVEVAILAASVVAAVVGLTFPKVRHLAMGVLLGILLSYPACVGGRLAVTKYYPRLKVTQILGFALLLTAVAFLPALLPAQEQPLYRSDFKPEELAARRQKVLDAIGKAAIAIVQGAPSVRGFEVFRQSNEFYYLTGLEVPHAYVLLDGRTGKTTLYLPHRDEERERNEGKQLAVEDAESVKALTGVDAVFGSDLMARHFRWMLIRAPFPALYTPFAPAEGRVESRDELLGGIAGLASDPWDGRGSREGQFLQLLRSRFPQFELKDLSPILDDLRLIKSPREIALLRRAAQLAGQGLVEAMRSTRAGVMEYQLDAAARYIFYVNGARGEAYSSITAGGQNAWYGHYFHNASRLEDGQMVLMDFAPDYRYYASDVARMWPVNGRYTADQRKLGSFILGIHKALLKRIKPGVTVDQILDDAAPELGEILERTGFTNPNHRRAAEAAVKWRGHLSHPVGMTVHDVGNYKNRPLQPGMVFAPDPMLWVPEEKLYVRIEDTVAVTESGVDNLSGPFVPSELDEIAALVAKGDGIVQKRPPLP